MATEALAVGVPAVVAIAKGKTPARDRYRLTFSDGTAGRAVARVIDDLPALAVESAFGLEHGVWGTLARGGLCHPGTTLMRPNGSLLLLSARPLGPGDEEEPPGLRVARAATAAVVNRWGDGPDTPDGFRDRMRPRSPEAADLADSLDDQTISLAAAGVKRLYRAWRALPPGGTLRLTWPLGDDWLRPPRQRNRGHLTASASS